MTQNKIITLSETAGNAKDKLTIKYFEQDDMFAHVHDCFELAYVIEGSAVQIINGVAETIKKGDYYIIDYDSVHKYNQCQNCNLINCLFLPEIIDTTLADCHSFDKLLRMLLIRYHRQYFEQSTVNRIFNDTDGSVLKLLLGMQSEYEQKNVGYLEVFRCRLLEIFVITMRKTLHNQEKKQFTNLSEIIAETIHFIESNYQQKQVLGLFCQEEHYSQQYISKRFKQETGITALEYLQKVRIKKSCELLAGSNLQIQEIARQVGYEDVKFFHSIFLRLIHMSPGEYRRHAKL